MVSGDFCEHDWPGSGCDQCREKYGWDKETTMPHPESYPFLNLARRYRVPYRVVLTAADQLKVMTPETHGSIIQQLMALPILPEMVDLLGTYSAGRLASEIALAQEAVWS